MTKYRVSKRTAYLLASASGAALFSSSAAEVQAEGVQTTDELIVYGTVVTRNRSDTVAPVLSYDLEYFQRFEPISAGDALKRVPGASFSSDILEYDRLQLRGLPAIYAQVQINGQLQRGPGSDSVFAVDRIPAELIDSVEIIRSPSADVSSDQIAGAANIELKKAGTIQGGWVRGSGFGVEGDELRGAGSVGYGTTAGDTSYLFSLDVQQRRNPKVKSADVFDADGVLEEVIPQSDTRDGTDYSFNGDVASKIGDGVMRLYGFYVLTDREEKEFTQTFVVADPDDNEIADQLEDIQQQNMSIVGEYTLPLGSNQAQVIVGYNRFREDLFTTEREADVGDPLELEQTESTDTLDQDWFSTWSYTANLGSLVTVKTGIDGRFRTRDSEQIIRDDNNEIDDNLSGAFDIEEQRLDPYVKATWSFLPGLTVETGLRYENTWQTLSGPEFGTSDNNANQLNPSAHIRYALTETTMLRFSVARTVLRPSFDQLTPFIVLEEPNDDSATIGNPNLRQETAWGVDAGFDQKLGERGILGFNFFNRAIKDKIELVGIAPPVPIDGCDIDPCNVFSFRNVGDARAYGIEVDVETPLTAIGLDNTTIFANYTWIETELTDPLTDRKRAFNDQPDYILNVGFIHSLPEWNSAFGTSYQKRGDSTEFGFDEITELSYDGNLEAFWETRFGKSTVLRFTASNLLDAEKLEEVQMFDPDLDGDPDGSEVEAERSGRLFMVTLRQAF
ncbi:MAG: TonB-dependent receptor [Hyphomicrobium sp.]|nr:TonB-dependent receptor [Hyphomicrobium sp.]